MISLINKKNISGQAAGSIFVLAADGSASGVSPSMANGEEGTARNRGAWDDTASEAGGDTGGERGSQRPAKKSWRGTGGAARRALRPRKPESASSIGDMAPDAFKGMMATLFKAETEKMAEQPGMIDTRVSATEARLDAAEARHAFEDGR